MQIYRTDHLLLATTDFLLVRTFDRADSPQAARTFGKRKLQENWSPKGVELEYMMGTTIETPGVASEDNPKLMSRKKH